MIGYGAEPRKGSLYPHSKDAKDWVKNADSLIPAAVLILFVTREEGLNILLTKRTDKLKNHAGQISFPGGRVDSTDKNIQQTALRETEEEIGLDSRNINIFGILDNYVVGTGFLVSPVMGYIEPPLELRRQENEVAEIFEVPLDFFIQTKNFKRYDRKYKGKTHHHLAITWNDYFIWGATAGILFNLSQRLNAD